jgi:CDP-diacylglycerol---serine O-phosphatidyltransferase
MKLFTLPNIITLLNLLCGCLAVVCAFNNDLIWAAYLVGIAAVLDFFDGFVARALKQFSPIGKELDSLADMVSFGLVPGIIMFHLLSKAIELNLSHEMFYGTNRFNLFNYPLAFAAFLIPLFSALRLAKFNVDTRQSDSFIGVPTPANSILICSLPLIIHQVAPHIKATAEFPRPFDHSAFAQFIYDAITNPWVLIGITVIMSFLLIAEIPLFALKVKGLGWKGNEIRYSFIGIAIVLMALLQYIALPLIIILYVLISLFVKPKKETESAV